MVAASGRFASSMTRLAAAHRPPILATLSLHGAVVSLGPARVHPAEVDSAVLRPPIGPRDFAGDPRIVIPMLAFGDRAMVMTPPTIDPLIFIPVEAVELGLDDVLSGFLRVLTGPPPHDA